MSKKLEEEREKKMVEINGDEKEEANEIVCCGACCRLSIG